MDDSLMVDVAGLRMFGRPGLSPFVVGEEGLDGWDDGVDMAGERVSRAQAHGSFAIPGFLESRTVSIQGLILAGSAREHSNFKSRLTGVLAGGALGRIQVTQGGVTQWAEAMRSTKPTVKRRHGTHYSDFQLQLWCPDPRKYGERQRFTVPGDTSVQVFHRGNFDAWPSFVVTGNMPGGYRLNVGGKIFAVTRGLTSGSHTIDYRDGRLRVNGSFTAGGVGAAALAPIPPGQVVTVRLEPVSGSGSVTATLYDTYI